VQSLATFTERLLLGLPRTGHEPVEGEGRVADHERAAALRFRRRRHVSTDSARCRKSSGI
jgi:hypothetical protein